MNLEYTDFALKNLADFNRQEAIKIRKKLDYLAQNYEDLRNGKNITSLVNFSNLYRYKISNKLRALFEIRDDKITILILKVGFRKDIYN